MKILNKDTDAVIYKNCATMMKETVEAAIEANVSLYKADLRGADLSNANLHGADLREADLSGVNLCDANLSNANLFHTKLHNANLVFANLNSVDLGTVPVYWADLSRAFLRGAYLIEQGQKLTLIGERPFFSIVGIGHSFSHNRLFAYITDCGVYVLACEFFGTLDAFTNAVNEKHGDNIHGREYRAAIELIKIHAELWTPKQESAQNERTNRYAGSKKRQ